MQSIVTLSIIVAMSTSVLVLLYKHKDKKHIKNIRNISMLITILTKYDWEKFKEKVSIPLPELPFDDDHIILIAYTDTFDFTPLKDNDVYITDDSTYLKYFTNPYVETMELSFKEGITVKNRNNIWLKGYPEAEEFLKYLMNPVTIHPFTDYMEKQLMPIPVMDENDLALFCEQFVLSEDPIKAEVRENRSNITHMK